MENTNKETNVSADAKFVAYKLSEEIFNQKWKLGVEEEGAQISIAFGAYMLKLGIDLANYDHMVKGQNGIDPVTLVKNYETNNPEAIADNHKANDSKAPTVKNYKVNQSADSYIKPLNDR